MLARANRVIRAEDFRRVVRRGRRTKATSAIYYATLGEQSDPARFGFIVSRAVGDSVGRNLLRRRLRAVARELVDSGLSGRDVVVRALPGAIEMPWAELRAEALSSMSGGVASGGSMSGGSASAPVSAVRA